ncbi:hypothetical protein [Streptomyces sp.]|uniref:hypothetical protein n=1 Tax=Streptomyces sp. TaxID=1931 RepID=UPI002F9447D6
MEAAITIMALLFFAFVALGVYAAVKVAKAAARGVDRTIDQAKRTVEDTTLRARSYGQGGVAGELAQLRLALRTSMRATQAALEAGAVEDASLRESLDLFKRLSGHARVLDEDLKRLEREPDRTGVAAQLPGLRERTEQVTKSADSLRWAARDRARKFADDDLATLSAEIDMEAGALRHWSDAESESASASERDWESVSTPESASAGSKDRERAGEPSGPREIPASDPRVTTYPWEKSARPETTN